METQRPVAPLMGNKRTAADNSRWTDYRKKVKAWNRALREPVGGALISGENTIQKTGLFRSSCITRLDRGGTYFFGRAT